MKIGSVGMFTDSSTLFGMPTLTAGIFRFQSELHEIMTDFDKTGWTLFCPDNWSPHCTLAYTLEEGNEIFLRASRVLLQKFRPMTGEFSSIGLVNITPPVKEILETELSR